MIASENGLLVVTVLLNVRGRDVGELRRGGAPADRRPGHAAAGLLPRVERPVRERAARAPAAADRDPVVLVVIFVLLYLTYRSFLEAAHVLLAVPFALSGGIYLLYAARLQLLGRRLGRLHRALRHGRADRRWSW